MKHSSWYSITNKTTHFDQIWQAPHRNFEKKNHFKLKLNLSTEMVRMMLLSMRTPMLLPAWSNWKCSKTDSYEPCHVFSHQWLLNLLLLLLTPWKKHWMYSQVSLCLDVACQLQGLGHLFLLQTEHIHQFLDTITLSKCLLSMICKCVLPHVEEIGSLVIWLAFETVPAWLIYDKLGYQVPLFSAFSWQYPSSHVHRWV